MKQQIDIQFNIEDVGKNGLSQKALEVLECMLELIVPCMHRLEKGKATPEDLSYFEEFLTITIELSGASAVEVQDTIGDCMEIFRRLSTETTLH